ncbi:dipeptide epimerase [Botrimarina sp.]|uniref:dipeptide epimerase n=1 Tax=Botrimarina sp. TaxID=2795802 RepID=UPI0032EC145D
MPELRYRPYELPLRETFTISRGSTDVQPTMIVQLGERGCYGYGEATTNRYYGVTLDRMADALERVRPAIEATPAERPDELLAAVGHTLRAEGPDAFPLCAIDQAAHDLWGKLAGKPLAELWGLDRTHAPLSNYTIGIDTIPKMVEKLQKWSDWPIFKIKLGTDNDLEIVRELRRCTDAVFRVDANCGWSADQAIDYSAELKELGVEFIEQPLPAEDTAGAERVFAGSPLPVVADESCVVEADVARCAGRFHGVNVKLMKCGGLAPARRMLEEARGLGMKTMVGCMTESTVGISAIAQLLPMLDYVDMDGAALLASDIAAGAEVVRGECRLPDAPGSGVRLLDGPL